MTAVTKSLTVEADVWQQIGSALIFRQQEIVACCHLAVATGYAESIDMWANEREKIDAALDAWVKA